MMDIEARHAARSIAIYCAVTGKTEADYSRLPPSERVKWNAAAIAADTVEAAPASPATVQAGASPDDEGEGGHPLCVAAAFQSHGYRQGTKEAVAFNRGARWWHSVAASGGEAQAVAAMSQAARDVLAERQRQISSEGWTPEHDDEHSFGELARAGAAYAAQSLCAEDAELECRPPKWWPRGWTWKPSSRRGMLVKSGALILAELERLDRAALAAKSQKGAA